MGELIGLWDVLGERAFSWYVAKTTSEALVRNSYFHPRNHIAEHWIERGNEIRGREIYEATAAELREARAPGHTLGPALYNVACVRVKARRMEEALDILEESLPMRPDLAATAARDPDLAPLRNDPRFKAMAAQVGSREP